MLSTYALLPTVTQLPAHYCRYTVVSENCEICLHISHSVKKNKSTCQIPPQEKVGHCSLTYGTTRVRLHLTTRAAIQSCVPHVQPKNVPQIMQQKKDIQILAVLQNYVSLRSYEIIRCHVPWPLIVGAHEGWRLPAKKQEKMELSQRNTESTGHVRGNGPKENILFFRTRRILPTQGRIFKHWSV